MAEDPSPPDPSQSVVMKRILVQSGLLTAALVGTWMVLDLDLRSYSTGTPTEFTTAVDTVESTPTEGTHKTWMDEGVDLLYAQHNPTSALSLFDQVLAQNPHHYGAIYQRAKALDALGDLQHALDAWKQCAPLAARTRDQKATQYIQQRIAVLQKSIPTITSKMNAGVELLHSQKQPSKAVAYFQEVLATWKTHYGAKYQLAVALEQSNQRDASKTAWTRVQQAATEIGEAADIDAATSALQRLHNKSSAE
jgi:tetratricopeptide (TPR) repeat protein